jgi:HAE1 family hydrophobic/amphiphilic exporter-1/multidrug efflux pump
MGGMVAATFLAIFFVPLFFRFLEDGKLTEKRSQKELFDEVHHAQRKGGHVAHTPGHPPHVVQEGDQHA